MMSAYVVEDATLSRILDFLFVRAARDRHLRLDTGKLGLCGHNLQAAATHPEPALAEACADLGTAMQLLNVGAVRGRYDDADEAGMIPQAFTLAEDVQATPIQAYKAMRCWLYQCSEDNVPKSPLFQAMSAVCDSLAHEIVCETEEYEAAPWG